MSACDGMVRQDMPEPCSYGADYVNQLRRELASSRAENLEQARLLGMSAQREAALRAKLDPR